MDTKWVSISAGATHTLAMKADDSLWSWGANDHGQLGDGGIEGKKVPTRVK
jgi:alpha-tubulin suppressor-like RCC1 family protein